MLSYNLETNSKKTDKTNVKSRVGDSDGCMKIIMWNLFLLFLLYLNRADTSDPKAPLAENEEEEFGDPVPVKCISAHFFFLKTKHDKWENWWMKVI